MAKQVEERLNARNFAEIISELRAGNCMRELTQTLNEVTEACVETGKSGTVTLKLTVATQGSSQAIVKDTITKTVPQFTVQPTVMFVDQHKNLTRRDSRQMDLSEVVKVEEQEESVQVNEEDGDITRIED